MPVSYHSTVRFLSLLAAVLLLTACESDEAKLNRIQGDRAIACLNAEKYQREYEMVALQVQTPLKDSLARQYTEFKTKCDLATREYNRFMRE